MMALDSQLIIKKCSPCKTISDFIISILKHQKWNKTVFLCSLIENYHITDTPHRNWEDNTNVENRQNFISITCPRRDARLWVGSVQIQKISFQHLIPVWNPVLFNQRTCLKKNEPYEMFIIRTRGITIYSCSSSSNTP